MTQDLSGQDRTPTTLRLRCVLGGWSNNLRKQKAQFHIPMQTCRHLTEAHPCVVRLTMADPQRVAPQTTSNGGISGKRATSLSSVAFGLVGAAEAYDRGGKPAEVGQEVTKTALGAGLGGVDYWLLAYGALIRL